MENKISKKFNKKFKIRNLELKNCFFLAPMEGINDIAFRLLCKKAGAGLTYTPLTHPLTKQKIHLEDKPGLQLFASKNSEIPAVISFMKKHQKKVSLFDFNLGCPAKTAKKHTFGYFLQDLKLIEKILKTMRNSTKKPVTCKIRKSPIAFDILKIANKYCDAITIHPRTQTQGYSGKPDLKFAEKIKKQSKIPVIYSGDVDEKNAFFLLKKFDAVMIGRKAIGNPNIFSALTQNENKKTKKINLTFQDYLKIAEKFNLSFKQIKLQAMNFTKGMKNARKMRLKLYKAKSLNDIKEVYGYKK